LVSDAEGQAAATAAMDDSAVRHMERLLEADTQGEFEILHQIGRGGMAAVYLAREIHLDRHVAIKVLPPELTFGHGVERFKREAKTAAALDHPNIIPIYRIASGGKIFWYAMKFIEGRSLDAHIKAQGRLELKETIALLEPVGRALEYAHRQQVVHRDIKPANVMLDDHQRVIVTDFGIAKPLTETTLTASGSLVGTPHYMSPEQGMGKPVTGASDQYSVAVMVYHMLTGQVPFEGDSAIEVLHKHCTASPPPMEVLRPGLPPHVYFTVRKALAKQADQRFASVMDFVTALREPSPDLAMAEAATSIEPVTEIIPQARPTEPLTDQPTTPIPAPPTADTPAASSAVTPPEPVAVAPKATPRPPPTAPATPRRRRAWLPILAVIGLIGAVTGVVFGTRAFLGRASDVTPEGEPAAASLDRASPPAEPPAGDATPSGQRTPTEPDGFAVAAIDSSQTDTATTVPDETTDDRPAAAGPRTPPTQQVTAAQPAPARPTPRPPSPPPVASVGVLANATTMEEGESQALGLRVRDARGRTLSDRSVRWRSSNTSVVSVSASGQVRARNPGRAYVVATVEGRRDSVTLTVASRLVRVAIGQRDTTLAPGTSLQLVAQPLGKDGPLRDRRISWSSSDASAVSVDERGRATARAEGSARIIARSEDKTDTVVLTVKAPAPPPAKITVAPASPPAGEQIALLVEGYVQLLRAKDTQRIEGLYPLGDGSDQRQRRALLEFLTDPDRAAQASGPTKLEPRIGDSQAVAQFGVRFRYRNPFGATRSRDVTFIAEFARAGRAWQLVSCRLDPKSRL
jgi:serine/threonine-protein kinase